jgi:hypothetical protein
MEVNLDFSLPGQNGKLRFVLKENQGNKLTWLCCSKTGGIVRVSIFGAKSLL